MSTLKVPDIVEFLIQRGATVDIQTKVQCTCNSRVSLVLTLMQYACMYNIYFIVITILELLEID